MESQAELDASVWRQILDSALDTAIISTSPEGVIRTWNAGAERLLGWTAGEMIGADPTRVFPEPDRAAQMWAAEMRDARELGLGGGAEGWRLRKDGSRLWAIGELRPIHGLNGDLVGFVKVLRDRSRAREALEALAEERRALEILNRAGSALSVETDVGKLVQIVTDAGVALTGAEFGAFFYNLVNDAGESYMLYTLSGAPLEAFSKFPMPRNTQVFAPTFNGEGVVRSDDITLDPRYGHNAPRKGMPEGHLPVRSYLAVPVTSRDGTVLGGLFFGHARPSVFTERSARGLEGLAAEAAVAIDNARLASDAARELAERRRAEESLRELNGSLEEQVRHRTEALERNSEALRQAQKMEAVGQLTGGVAHDFNNLLQVIIGNLEVIRRSAPPEASRLIRAANNAMNGAKRAGALTQRLLAFARRQPLEPKPLDLNALVYGMSDLMHRTLGETISVETVLGAGLWRIGADANQLEAAILNLAVNARDAMQEGGSLTIETANSHIDEAYAGDHAEVVPGQYVAISVTDTGHGMSAETIRQAFEPFFTTKPVGQGTGLGLSQVYGFVKQSGGHVRIYSEVGSGTTVRIYLPRLLGEERASEATVEAPVPEGTGLEIVLVVEDDEGVRMSSVESLQELGYHVLEAEDGRQGLRILEQTPEVDLLFTDVVLPGGMTGAELAAKARGLRPELKVLFTTGYARNAIVHQGRLDKGVQLLTKPFTFAELAANVRDILDGVGPIKS